MGRSEEREQGVGNRILSAVRAKHRLLEKCSGGVASGHGVQRKFMVRTLHEVIDLFTGDVHILTQVVLTSRHPLSTTKCHFVTKCELWMEKSSGNSYLIIHIIGSEEELNLDVFILQ